MNRKIAIDNVKSGGSTLVVFSENDCVSCSKRGVSPLLELYESGKDFSEYQAVDKVIVRCRLQYNRRRRSRKRISSWLHER